MDTGTISLLAFVCVATFVLAFVFVRLVQSGATNNNYESHNGRDHQQEPQSLPLEAENSASVHDVSGSATAAARPSVRCVYDSWNGTQRAVWEELVTVEPSLLECNVNGTSQLVGTMEVHLNFCYQSTTGDSAPAQQPARVELVRSTRTGLVTPLIWGDVMVPWMMLCDYDGCANAAGYKYGGAVQMGGLWPDSKLYFCLDCSCLSQKQLTSLKMVLGAQKKKSETEINEFLKGSMLDRQLTDAVKEGIKLVSRSQNSVQFVEQTDMTLPAPHCVVFLKDDINCSCLGQIGCPVQPIRLTKDASPGNVAHEILHALGFHHTHSRFDRDKYVHIHTKDIEDGKQGNFDKVPMEFDIQEYDYSSIMHYPAVAWPREPGLVTIEVIGHKGVHIGQREALSAGDIASLSTRYPGNINCTFESKTHNQQAWFRCQTCWGPGAYGCCMACALSCHKGHDTIDVGPTNAFCDCGALHHRYMCTRFSTDERCVEQLAWKSSSSDGYLCAHCARICTDWFDLNTSFIGLKPFCCSCNCSGNHKDAHSLQTVTMLEKLPNLPPTVTGLSRNPVAKKLFNALGRN